ncbi:bacterioferritin, partial [Mycobacterium sp. ITM-2017-0098]
LDTKFHSLLNDQVRSELGASQQYLAIAVYFDSADLPQLAKLFCRQSVEERNHALMFVQYLIDRGVQTEIPALEPVRNAFETPRDA